MSRITIVFSGNVKKFKLRDAGEKKVAEFSICRKNYSGKKDAEDTFTWVNVSVYDPKQFILDHLRDGVPVAGEGEAVLRSYAKSDGSKGHSLDVRCQNQGIDFPFSEGSAKGDGPAPRPAAKAGGTDVADEPPFARHEDRSW